MSDCEVCGGPVLASDEYAEWPVAHRECSDASARERFGREVLAVVLAPGPMPIGAAGSVMREAWELGRELERGRLAVAREIERAARRAAVDKGHTWRPRADGSSGEECATCGVLRRSAYQRACTVPATVAHAVSEKP